MLGSTETVWVKLLGRLGSTAAYTYSRLYSVQIKVYVLTRNL